MEAPDGTSENLQHATIERGNPILVDLDFEQVHNMEGISALRPDLPRWSGHWLAPDGLSQSAPVGIEIRVDRVAEIALGRRATTGELAALDEHGFVVVPALLSRAEVDVLDAEFERLVAEDPQSRRHELGTRRAKGDNEDEAFAVCWRHRVVLDAAVHVLGSTFEVGRIDLRDPNPGHGEQRHHPDHGQTPVPGITATWYLDAFTADNGATRILPGSHRSGVPWATEIPIPGTEAPIPGEVIAVGPAGSLLLRDARLFHAAGRNSTKSPRRSAFVFYQHDIPDGVVRQRVTAYGLQRDASRTSPSHVTDARAASKASSPVAYSRSE